MCDAAASRPEGPLHDLATLTVGDLVLTVAPATARSTVEVVVDRDASLIIKAPCGTSAGRAHEFVDSKRSWIYRRLAEKDALVGPLIVKSFVDGEGFAYLGRSHRLLIDPARSGNAVRLERGRFVLPRSATAEGCAAMRMWYIETGRDWLSRRIEAWGARAGTGTVEVDVRDLGYRWGSVRVAADREEPRINIHWATLQLPPSLIDYVLVHELAHLEVANHSPDYWAVVARLMPGYEVHRRNLAGIGKHVWLGATIDAR